MMENSDHGCWVGLCGANLENSDLGKIRQNLNHLNMKNPENSDEALSFEN
jgi:hypothetical protein